MGIRKKIYKRYLIYYGKLTESALRELINEHSKLPDKPRKIPTTPAILLTMDDERFISIWNSGCEFSEPIGMRMWKQIEDRARKLKLM